MITVKVNDQALRKRVDQLKELVSPQGIGNVMRGVAISMLPVVHDRIHVEGRAADGSPIGTYSVNYQKYTRPKYNRVSDPKVVLSLTMQMENDFSVVATQKSYGLGFKNPVNFDKSQYVEATYKKKIFSLTTGEREQAVQVAKQIVQDALRQ